MVFLTEAGNMFWGVTIDGGKRYSQTVESSFHISMAALEPSSVKEKGVVSIMIQHEKAEFLLCTLQNGKLPQQPLDLNFTEGEEVTFFLSGPGIVHLTGFLLDEEGDFEDSMRELTSDDSMQESEEEKVPELEPITSKNTAKKDKKRKIQEVQSKGVKKKKVEIEEESEDEFDKDDSFFDEEAEETSDEEDDPGAVSLADIFDGEGDEEEESEDEEEMMITKVTPNSKLSKKEKKEKRKSEQGTKQNTPKKSSTNTEEISTPVMNNLEASGDASTKKKKKKKKKKNKGNDEENVTKQGEKTAKTKTTEQQIPKKKVVAGGTVVEELKVGHGPEARPGKMAHMYYTGKLANTGKQFDSCISGKPFKFRLGKNEVIKGWENGVNGMKVGGKRKLTVPAQQGYGSERQGPIPPNSTLVFDIELKAVS